MEGKMLVTQLQKVVKDITYNLVILYETTKKLEAVKDMPNLRSINTDLTKIINELERG